jgi:hypothetical protein
LPKKFVIDRVMTMMKARPKSAVSGLFVFQPHQILISSGTNRTFVRARVCFGSPRSPLLHRDRVRRQMARSCAWAQLNASINSRLDHDHFPGVAGI